MTADLAELRCKPCEGGVQPLTAEQAAELMLGLDAGWTLSDDGLSIARSFEFPAYGQTVEYGRCHVSYTTHAINGLSDNDFICAAKIDRLAESTLR
jgi:4a-hydroxytetrahydrobiopterin dehydratase